MAELARRRETLISLAEAQREQLRGIFGELKMPVSLVSTGFALSRILKLAPAVTLGLTAFFLIFRRRRLAKPSQLIGIGWMVLRLMQALGLKRRA